MLRATPHTIRIMIEVYKTVYKNFEDLMILGLPQKQSTAMRFHVTKIKKTTGLYEKAAAISNLAKDTNILDIPQPGHSNPVVM